MVTPVGQYRLNEILSKIDDTSISETIWDFFLRANRLSTFEYYR